MSSTVAHSTEAARQPREVPAAPTARRRRRPAPARPRLAALTIGALRATGRLSLRGIQRLGGVLGGLLARLPSRPRANTLECLALAFPELTARERTRMARRSLVEDTRMLLEHAAFWTWDRERALGLVSVAEGGDLVEQALARGRGVIIAGLHLGSIEALSIHCAANYGLLAHYRAPRIEELGAFFRKARERFGGQLLPAGTSSVRLLLRGLREGRLLGIPCDQDPGIAGSVFAPYFGVPTNTTTLIGRLAASTGAEVFVGYAERLPDARGFAAHFVPVSDEVRSEDLVASATALNRTIETCVRRCPEQALWSYRRFRRRPWRASESASS